MPDLSDITAFIIVALLAFEFAWQWRGLDVKRLRSAVIAVESELNNLYDRFRQSLQSDIELIDKKLEKR